MQSTFLMTWLPIMLGLVLLAVWAAGVADFARTDERDIRSLPQAAWLCILLLGSFMGALMWFAAGRPRRS